MLNPREWIDRNRWPRFWTPAVLPEHKALPAGHNCTLGTILVVTYGATEKSLIALVRVHRLYSGDKPEPSFTIKPQTASQRFMVELCLPTSSDVNGALRFVASGRHLPMTSSKQVLGLASVVSEGSLSHAATMDAGVVKELTKKSQFVTINNLSAETLVPQKHTSIADETERDCCCRCQHDWWDDNTGKIVYCDGPCDRSFHTSCAGLDNVPQGDWLCARCTGEDNAICVVCDKEWFCDESETEDGKPNGYYTGSMIQCAGVCEHWFHQECHHPAIPDRYVCTETGRKRGKKKRTQDDKWHCSSCKEVADAERRAAARARPEPAAVAEPERCSTRRRTQFMDDNRIPSGSINTRESWSHVGRMASQFVEPTGVEKSTLLVDQRPKPSTEYVNEQLYKCVQCDKMRPHEQLKEDAMHNLSCVEECQSSRRRRNNQAS